MTTDNGTQDRPQPSAGERLRKAREAAGLTVNEVADRQHLRPAVITAIEDGDYRKIDSELFLKGYVRAYATQVGVDPESVIRQLDQELEPLREEQKKRVEANPLVDIQRRKRRKRQIARIVVLLAILVGIFYAGSLYLARQQADTTVAPSGSAETMSEEEGASAPPEESNVDANETPDGGAPLSQAGPEQVSPDDSVPATSDIPGANESMGDTETMEQARGTGTGSDGSAGTGDASSGTGVVEPATDSDVAAPSEGVTDPAIRSQPLEEPASQQDVAREGQLLVEFSGDCWIEVKDRSGRTLEASLRSAGDTLELTGQAPLTVVLGAVSGVESISYSGETVNLADRQVRNNRLVLNLP
jgi:cytoskeleton protein RodZ